MADMITALEELASVYRKTIAESRSNDNIDAFVKSPIVNQLRCQGEFICDIEKYCLPYVTALICNSSPSLIGETRVKYELVRSLYSSEKEGSIKEAFSQPIEEFKTRIMPYLDGLLVLKMSEYENQLRDAILKLENNISEKEQKLSFFEKSKIPNTQKKLNRLQSELKKLISGDESDKKDGDSSIDTKKEVKNQGDIEKLKNKIEKAEQELAIQKAESEKLPLHIAINKKTLSKKQEDINRLIPYFELIKDQSKDFTDKLDRRRKDCYQHIRSGPYQKEIDFINNIINGGDVDPEQVNKLKADQQAIDYIIDILEKGIFKSSTFRAVKALMERDFCNSSNDKMVALLMYHREDVKNYLIASINKPIEDLKKDTVTLELLKAALKQETVSENLLYGPVWDEIEDSNIWKLIMAYLDDENTLAKIVSLSEIKGKILKAFLDCLIGQEVDLPHFTLLAAQQKVVNAQLIFRITQSYDKQLNSAKQDVRKKSKLMEMQENERSEKAFSALYEPMNKLELLAHSLMMIDHDIPKETIVNELVKCVEKYRTGLEKLGVQTAEDYDVWKLQKHVEYDNKKHRFSDGNTQSTDKVIVETMGYRYPSSGINEDGSIDYHIEYAKVIPVKETDDHGL